MTLEEYARIRKAIVDDEIDVIKARMNTYPQGLLLINRDRGHFKWFLLTGKGENRKRKYLPKSKIRTAEKLALKSYDFHHLHELSQESKAIDMYLRHIPSTPTVTQQMLTQTSGYRPLLESQLKLPENLQEWANAPYEGNPSYPDALIHKTKAGILVRSKSESIIASALYDRGVPFRYEAPLKVGNETFYPDFEGRNIFSGDFIWWEHFGLIDKPEYLNRMLLKQKKYIENGFRPMGNLIITTETEDHPLDMTLVLDLIDHFFCSQF